MNHLKHIQGKIDLEVAYNILRLILLFGTREQSWCIHIRECAFCFMVRHGYLESSDYKVGTSRRLKITESGKRLYLDIAAAKKILGLA